MNLSLPAKFKFATRKLDIEKILHTLGIIAIVLGLLEPFFYPTSAKAVSVTGFIRLDRMKANTATGGTVCATPQAGGTATTVKVTFPGTGTLGASSYGVNSTATNWTVTTTNLPTGATAWPGIGTASSVSGASVTFPSTTLTNGTQYCFNFTGTSTLTTPTSNNQDQAGSIITQAAGPTPLDTVNLALADISNDQITVTATVPATFSFSLGSTTAALGSLPTSGAPNTATAITATVSTNAQNGWLSWAKNANANSALTSASTGDGVCFGGNYPTCTGAAFQTGAGNVHSLSGAAGYGLSVAAGSGSPTVATEYAGSATSFGSLDNTKYEQIASKNAPAASNTFTLTFGAEASATNKAATDYTDTVTISAAGQF